MKSMIYLLLLANEISFIGLKVRGFVDTITKIDHDYSLQRFEVRVITFSQFFSFLDFIRYRNILLNILCEEFLEFTFLIIIFSARDILNQDGVISGGYRF